MQGSVEIGLWAARPILPLLRGEGVLVLVLLFDLPPSGNFSADVLELREF